jgi:hypothetical protein
MSSELRGDLLHHVGFLKTFMTRPAPSHRPPQVMWFLLQNSRQSATPGGIPLSFTRLGK